MVQYYVYILECADNSFYVGVTNNLEKRLSEHQSDSYPKSYTHRRKPFNLVYHSVFNNVKIAILFEKKIKGWSRKKKMALINGDWDEIKRLSKRKSV